MPESGKEWQRRSIRTGTERKGMAEENKSGQEKSRAQTEHPAGPDAYRIATCQVDTKRMVDSLAIMRDSSSYIHGSVPLQI